MRTLVLGLMGATALTFASAANATLIITDQNGISVTGPSTADNINFSFGYSGSGLVTPFSESVQWMNTLGGFYGITLSTTAALADGPNDVDVTAAFLTGTGILSPINLMPNPFNTDLIENYALAGLPLDTGTYTLTIEGTRGTTGSYGGNVAFQAGAVPEPATWALMLLGFGAVGWQIRRRRHPVLAQAV
jgi:hypothetical protein